MPMLGYGVYQVDPAECALCAGHEMNDSSFRPAIADVDANIANYDGVFVGFPIWWYVAPTIINTFLESYDFSDKIIVPFATSGGSSFGKRWKKSVLPFPIP